MSEERDAAARRYSRDMRRIREERDVSIEDIHEDTRIAKTLIESFEEGSLYDHPTFNQVYLRSFVRVYAEAIDLAPDEALDALETALDGTYGNGLAVEHFGEDPIKSTTTETEISEEEAASDTSQKDENGEEPGEEESPEGEDESSEDEEEYTGTEPPAGGVGGRGGIVGPARAVGTGHEESPDEKEDSFRTEGPREKDTHSSFSVDEGHSREPEEDEDASPASSPDSSTDDPPVVEDSSFWDEDDSSSRDQERSGDGSDVDSGATPIGSTEDPEPEQPQRTSEGSSSTLSAEEDSIQDSPSVSPGQEEEASPQPVGEGFGIVGEPEELGSATSPSASAPSDSPSPGAPARPSESSSGSGLSNLWGGRRREMLISGVGILVLVGLLLGLGWSYFTETEPSTASMPASEATEDTTTQATTQDTVATVSTQEQSPPVSLSLGDTLYVTVVAETNVSELRVRRNGDLRRPYWIEEGEARVFPFTDQITFEENLDNARFLLGRYPFPSPERDAQGRIVIDRETVESFADTARGRPQSLSASVDTISLDDPVPGGEID